MLHRLPAGFSMSSWIDAYLSDAPRWGSEMAALRDIARDMGLTEDLKWAKPCFIWKGANVAILQPFRDECRLMFFKGVLLPDPEGLLTSQGDNTQGARVLRVTSVAEIGAKAPAIRALIAAAIGVEDRGETVAYDKRHDLDLPQELIDALDADDEFAAAFRALTPGRQRSWVLYFTGAKQSATRAARIAKAAPAIRAGRGWNERPG